MLARNLTCRILVVLFRKLRDTLSNFTWKFLKDFHFTYSMLRVIYLHFVFLVHYGRGKSCYSVTDYCESLVTLKEMDQNLDGLCYGLTTLQGTFLSGKQERGKGKMIPFGLLMPSNVSNFAFAVNCFAVNCFDLVRKGCQISKVVVI